METAASNYITLPTDCPQRNERMGWMGDANVYALAGSYNADTYQFLRQWMNCVRQSQGEDGMTSHTSPNYPSYDEETGMVNVGGMSFDITWDSAIVFIPYFLYEQYGDTTIIDENMDAIYKYMENLEAIHQHIGSNSLSVNQVADYCHLNAIYLNRIFRKERNISIGQYIIRERMTLAAKLLGDSSISTHTVAEKTGYMNYSYFSTAFKKFYGCSPQNYVERRDDRK